MTNNDARRTTVMSPGDTNDGETVTWQDEFTPQNDTSDLNGMIAGKTAASPNLLSRFNTQPQINAPSIRELFGNTALDRMPTLPKITNADDKQDIHQVIASPKASLAVDNAIDHKETNIAAPALPNAEPQSGELIKDVALAITPARKLPRTDTLANEMPFRLGSNS